MRYTERPDLYDLNQPGDVFPGEREHYLALARQAGDRVLELGYGTGRVGLHLARSGVAVVGLDRAETMLAEARRVLQAEPPEVSVEDIMKRQYLLGGIDLATAPGLRLTVPDRAPSWEGQEAGPAEAPGHEGCSCSGGEGPACGSRRGLLAVAGL